MLRNDNVQALHWADKTMSEIRAQQLEACEQRLMATPELGLFDEASRWDGQQWWQLSHDGQLLPHLPTYPTIEDLRQQVLSDLPVETALLSLQEQILAERLLVENGVTQLMEWEEYEAAESLVRRLWCTVCFVEGIALLLLQSPLRAPLQSAMKNKQTKRTRAVCSHVDHSTRAVLYMCGFVHASQPMGVLQQDLSKLFHSPIRVNVMIQRFLRASFRYAHTAQGEMMLLHPGYARPDQLLHNPPQDIMMPMDVSGADLIHAFEGILPEETAAHTAMAMQLSGSTRLGIFPQDAAEDLRILAKQGVPLSELQGVLASLLIVHPTPAMMDALFHLAVTTPRWRGIPAVQVN